MTKLEQTVRRVATHADTLVHRARSVRAARSCSVCGSKVAEFLPLGRPPRLARCPFCRSVERHRFQVLILRQHLSENIVRSVLHVAPEAFLLPTLRQRGGPFWIGVDYARQRRISVQGDLTALGMRDDSVDLVVCSHVLEHIPDDGAAIAELARVLHPDGWALIDVPVDPSGGPTHEDYALGPAERAERYGQADHVRYYGTDTGERLTAAGLVVERCIRPQDLGSDVAFRFALDPNSRVWLCRPAQSGVGRNATRV